MCTLTTLVLHLEDKSSTGSTRVFDVAAGRKQTEERNRRRRRLRLPGENGQKRSAKALEGNWACAGREAGKMSLPCGDMVMWGPAPGGRSVCVANGPH